MIVARGSGEAAYACALHPMMRGALLVQGE